MINNCIRFRVAMSENILHNTVQFKPIFLLSSFLLKFFFCYCYCGNLKSFLLLNVLPYIFPVNPGFLLKNEYYTCFIPLLSWIFRKD